MNFIPQFKVRMNIDAILNLNQVFASGYIGQGPMVEKLEEKLRKTMDFDFGVTVNSGTSALQLALHLIGVGPGDKVISTAMTCSATNEAIVNSGADIIWADVNEFGLINPSSVAEKMQDDVKAVMAVDWGGLPCDYDELRAVTEGVPIIEDAAHAYLAEYCGESINRHGGDYVAYSFQAIKHLTTGDGGLLVVPNFQYERAKLLRWFGLDRTSAESMRCYNDISESGFKYHMNDINASIGLANLDYSVNSVKSVREQALRYDSAFDGKQMLPAWPTNALSSFWLYTIHVPNPQGFSEWMKEQRVGVSQTHNRNDHYTCFAKYQTDLPNLDKFFDTMTCIPIGWWLTREDQDYIIDKTLEWIDGH